MAVAGRLKTQSPCGSSMRKRITNHTGYELPGNAKVTLGTLNRDATCALRTSSIPNCPLVSAKYPTWPLSESPSALGCNGSTEVCPQAAKGKLPATSQRHNNAARRNVVMARWVDITGTVYNCQRALA